MMHRLLLSVVTVGAWSIVPVSLVAQSALDVRTSILFESYSFDPGLAFNKVTQFTVPVPSFWRLSAVRRRRLAMTASIGRQCGPPWPKHCRDRAAA